MGVWTAGDHLIRGICSAIHVPRLLEAPKKTNMSTAAVAFTTSIEEIITIQRLEDSSEEPTVEEQLAARKLMVSRRGMIYVVSESGSVVRSLPAGEVTALQPCTRLIVDEHGEQRVETIPSSALITTGRDTGIRCLFPNVKTLSDFSRYLVYFNELHQEEKSRSAAVHVAATAPPPTLEELISAVDSAPDRSTTGLKIEEDLFKEETTVAETVEPSEVSEAPITFALNPFDVTNERALSPQERIELLRDPVPVWEALATKVPTTTSRSYIDEFFEESERERRHAAVLDRQRALEAYRSSMAATHRLKIMAQPTPRNRSPWTVGGSQQRPQMEILSPSRELSEGRPIVGPDPTEFRKKQTALEMWLEVAKSSSRR